MKMRAAVALIILGWATAMPSQTSPGGPNAAMAPQLTKARRANAALKRQYTSPVIVAAVYLFVGVKD